MADKILHLYWTRRISDYLFDDQRQISNLLTTLFRYFQTILDVTRLNKKINLKQKRPATIIYSCQYIIYEPVDGWHFVFSRSITLIDQLLFFYYLICQTKQIPSRNMRTHLVKNGPTVILIIINITTIRLQWSSSELAVFTSEMLNVTCEQLRNTTFWF